jgi:broad specificity phosphatase PhoE
VTGGRLVLVRHGITDWNREGRFQGRLDPPLGEDGRREAALVAERLAADPELRPDRIISSTLDRAMTTARAIGEAVGVDVEPDERLVEIGQGRWEGRTHADLELREAARYAAWRNGSGRRRPPGGELTGSALRRVRSLVLELARTQRARSICLVSHGGTLRVAARVIFGLDAARSWALDVDNASVSAAARVGRKWRLERWNDTHHVLGREATHVDEAEGRPLAL